MVTGAGRQVTIFVGESDQYHHQPLYLAIVERLRREGCGGATVTRGLAGFGASSLIHTASIVRLSIDLPIVITVIDRPARIARILDAMRDMAPHALIVAQDVEIVQSGVPFKEGLPHIAVSEVMQRNVVTVRPETLVKEVVELLVDRDFTAVPVVDDANRVVGMISDRDLLTRGGTHVGIDLQRATDPAFVRQLHEALQGSTRKVEELMTREVVTLTPGTSLGAAAKLMVEHHLKRLPVVDAGGRLTGILGRLDVLNTLAAVHLPEWHPAAPAGGATVADVMDAGVATAYESAPIEELFERLVSSVHKRVVIVDATRHVLGIVADSDLLSRVGREHWPGVVELLASKAPIQRLSEPARRHVQKLRGKTAGDVMSRDVVSVRQEMPDCQRARAVGRTAREADARSGRHRRPRRHRRPHRAAARPPPRRVGRRSGAGLTRRRLRRSGTPPSSWIRQLIDVDPPHAEIQRQPRHRDGPLGLGQQGLVRQQGGLGIQDEVDHAPPGFIFQPFVVQDALALGDGIAEGRHTALGAVQVGQGRADLTVDAKPQLPAGEPRFRQLCRRGLNPALAPTSIEQWYRDMNADEPVGDGAVRRRRCNGKSRQQLSDQFRKTDRAVRPGTRWPRRADRSGARPLCGRPPPPARRRGSRDPATAGPAGARRPRAATRPPAPGAGPAGERRACKSAPAGLRRIP